MLQLFAYGKNHTMTVAIVTMEGRSRRQLEAESAMSARGSRSVNIGLRNVVLTILIGLGLVFIWQIRGTLMLTFAAVILVVLFTMPVRLLVDRLRINRLVAILVSVIGFFVILVLIGIPILRTIGDQYEPLKNGSGGRLWIRCVESSHPRSAADATRTRFVKDVIPIIDDLARRR